MAQIHAERLAAVRHKMVEAKIDALVISPSTNLEYLIGEPRKPPFPGTLVWPNWFVSAAWITVGRDPLLTLARMAADYEFENPEGVALRVLPDDGDTTAFLKSVIGHLGLTGRTIAVEDRAPSRLLVELAGVDPSLRLVSANQIMQDIRARKTPEEVEILREASRITDACFGELVKRIRAGMTEFDLIAEIDHQLRSLGSEPAYPIGAWGWGGGFPRPKLQRNHPIDAPLLPGTILAFDFGAWWKGYCTDFSRTVLLAEPSPEFRLAYDAVVRAQERVLRALKPGALAEDVYREGMAELGRAGLAEFFPDRIGHGIGMDVHETPSLFTGDTTSIVERMVLAVEPQVFKGPMHIRLEDLVVVTENGGEKLNEFTSDLLILG